MASARNSGTLGWILVIIGGALILNHWLQLEFEWTTVVMLLGALIFIAGVVGRDHGAVFPGTFLFLFGLFFILKEHHRILMPWWDVWVLVLLALGIAFVVLYLFEPNKGGRLLPGIILIVIAFFLLYSPWCISDIFGAVLWLWHLWPLALIVIGISLILRALRGEG